MPLSPSNKARILRRIDDASYEELLTQWRQLPLGSLLFQGEVGHHFAETMRKKREGLTQAELVEISKRVGWKNEPVVDSISPIEGETE